MSLRGSLHLLLWLQLAAAATASGLPQVTTTVQDYGFPRCYTSFLDYDTAFTGSSGIDRPLTGYKRFPYDGATAAECNALSSPPPLVALGPHWSPIGITVYDPPTDRENCRNCLPNDFDGTLIVASHGSWNRSPFIGYNVKAYDFAPAPDVTARYSVTDQRTLLPPLRNANTGTRIRPVDVRTSPVGDGALLLTADRDDLDARTRRGGGLYRVRGGAAGGAGDARAEPIDLAAVNAAGDNPAGVILERVAGIPCARQIAVSKANPRLVFVSTMGLFCTARTGDKIWVVQLEPSDSVVAKGPAVLAEGFLQAQGIDWSRGSLYVATGGSSTNDATMGNCILEIPDVDELAAAVLDDANEPLRPPGATAVVCDFTQQQWQHSWRSLRVHPAGEYALVSVGAECNWSLDCHDGSRGADDLQTTLVRVELAPTGARGAVSVAARGVRNAIGFYFDVGRGHDHLIFTSFGSDQAAGVPGATSANNVPDCTIEVLPLNMEAPPSAAPSGSPSAAPTDVPFDLPSGSPTAVPSEFPSKHPSGSPSAGSSAAPSGSRSAVPSATSSPSAAEHYVVCGSGIGGSCSEGDERIAGWEEKHEVRCCRDKAGRNWKRPKAGCDVWARSQPCREADLPGAREFCQGIGGRLCTRDEVGGGCTRGSGCGFDGHLNWSSTPSLPSDVPTGHPSSAGPTCAARQDLQELQEEVEEDHEEVKEDLKALREEVKEDLQEVKADQQKVIEDLEQVKEDLQELRNLLLSIREML